ncbi:MAG: hypothetical protein ACPLVI_07790, partial [Thermoplasmata archaeon]
MQKIDEETRIRVINMFIDGYAYRDIANKVGIGATTVNNIIEEFRTGNASYLPDPSAGYVAEELVDLAKYMKSENLSINALVDSLEIALVLRRSKIDPIMLSNVLDILKGQSDINGILGALLMMNDDAIRNKMPLAEYVAKVQSAIKEMEKISAEIDKNRRELEGLKKQREDLNTKIEEMEDEADILSQIREALGIRKKEDISQIVELLGEKNLTPDTIKNIHSIIKAMNRLEIPLSIMPNIMDLLNYLNSIGLDVKNIDAIKLRTGIDGNIDEIIKKAIEFYSEKENLQKEFSDLLNRKNRLEGEIKTKEQRKSLIDNEITSKEKNIKEMNEKIKSLNDEIEEKEEELRKLKVQVDENQNNYEKLKSSIEDLKQQIPGILAEIKDLRDTKEELENKLNGTLLFIKILEDRKEQIEKSINNAKEEKGKIEAQLSEESEKLNGLRDDEKELNERIAALELKEKVLKEELIIAEAIESIAHNNTITDEALVYIKERFNLLGDKQSIRELILNLIIKEFGKDIGLIYEKDGQHRLISAKEMEEFKRNEKIFKEFKDELENAISEYPEYESKNYPMITGMVSEGVNSFWINKFKEIENMAQKNIATELIPAALNEAIEKISNAALGISKENSFSYGTVCSICKKPTKVEISYADLGKALHNGIENLKVKCEYGHVFEIPVIEIIRGMAFPEMSVQMAKERIFQFPKLKIAGV